MSSPARARLSRRTAVASGLALGAGSLVPGVRARQATPIASPLPDPQAIIAIAEAAVSELNLRAVLLNVIHDGREIVTHALGESMTGVPATTEMHFRNGAVAISYVSTLLLQLVDEGVIALDDTIDQWLPELPDADRVTLRMLANMTSGYPDYVPNPDFVQQSYADPFRAWTPEELLAFTFASPRVFEPGENWGYSHAGYVILGLALEAITGEQVADLLVRYILDPLNLSGTGSNQTAQMPEPVLHAFSSERRVALGIPSGTPFYEESTFWNPSWTITRGAVQYTTIADMASSFEAIGRGDLLSAESYQEQTGGQLLGFGAPVDGCASCRTLNEQFSYGLGIAQSGNWLVQNPLFSGGAGTVVYHPGARITVAVATTFTAAAFDDNGDYANGSTQVCRRIAAMLVPSDPPA